MSFLDQLSAKVNQGFNQVTSQTKDFTEQVKIENEIKNLEKAAQANYEELGRAMYNASRHSSGELASVGDVSSAEGATAGTAFSGEDVSTGAASSGAAADYEVIMRQIDGILQQIQEKKAAKQEIMNRVICPSCGKSVPAGTKFCSYCEAPMEQTPVETGDSGASEIGDSCSAGAGDSAEKEEGSAGIGGSAGAEAEEISN